MEIARLLAAVMLVWGCRGNAPDPGAGKVQTAGPAMQADTASRAVAAGPEDVSAPAAPAAAATAPAFGCRVRRADIMSLDPSPILPVQTVDAVVGKLAATHLADGPEDGEADVKLFVQYALRRAETEEGVFHFGAKGFLTGPPARTAFVAEAEGYSDGPATPECARDTAGEACRAYLLERIARPGLDMLLARLGARCRLEKGTADEVAAMLSAADPWVRAAAAQAAGERGLKNLSATLLARLDDADPNAVVAVIGALGRLAPEQAAAALVKRARHADEVITSAVAVALADLDTPDARRYLREWARSHPLAVIRQLAAELLREKIPVF